MMASLPLDIFVALPSTLTAEANSLLEKTIKLGFIARMLSIFRVRKVMIYKDKSINVDDEVLICKLLNYMICPQYLRRKVFPLDPDLKYVGLLPPLQTPNHPLEKKMDELPEVSYREGLIVKKNGNRYLIDAGLDMLLAVHDDKARRVGERVIIMISRHKEKVEVQIVNKDDVPYYFGYEVEATRRGLKDLIKMHASERLIIATSKYGKSIEAVTLNLIEKLKERKGRVLVIFGSPFKGLYDIARYEGFNLNDFVDFTINFVPNQGTKTIRTEEAVGIVLAILNLLSKSLC